VHVHNSEYYLVRYIELTASIIEMVAALGWVLIWFKYYTREHQHHPAPLSAGWTLQDPDLWANASLLCAAFIYAYYNISVLALENYTENTLYQIGDFAYFANACFYLISSMRCAGVFWWCPTFLSLRLPCEPRNPKFSSGMISSDDSSSSSSNSSDNGKGELRPMSSAMSLPPTTRSPFKNESRISDGFSRLSQSEPHDEDDPDLGAFEGNNGGDTRSSSDGSSNPLLPVFTTTTSFITNWFGSGTQAYPDREDEPGGAFSESGGSSSSSSSTSSSISTPGGSHTHRSSDRGGLNIELQHTSPPHEFRGSVRRGSGGSRVVNGGGSPSPSTLAAGGSD
jgi:hypothetical protein